MAFMVDCRSGATSTRVYVMLEVNMPVMTMATDFVKYT